MSRNPRYDVLFEPIQIGPVRAPNRFYCTPHALGTGQQMPHTRAAMREVRAEGGWGVVNTGYCSIHPTSDDSPFPYCRLWDDQDIGVHALMVDAVHRHGALAGVELWHGTGATRNRLTRMPLLSASGISVNSTYPSWMSLAQPHPMSRKDIREFRRWHVDAAKRARSAGFDIVYVYAGMNYGPYQFLLPWLNKRTDEYGGSLDNRVRLTREILEDVKEAVGQTCAIALRFSTDDLLKVPGGTMASEAHEVIAMLAEVPDLWDLKSANWIAETASARFAEEGAHEPWVSFAKPLTPRPVVGVGRFTSPDAMVSQIKRGVLDLIGAARPSIADPFLPKKIDEGREDEIRECIGCNICVSAYHDGVPVRCTQNPTMGEEWRRGWHPERIPPGDSQTSVLIVGAGPAGLECARALAQRGFSVTLAEATEELGGRVGSESKLPGLATWARVRDYRTNLIEAMANVDVYRSSPLSCEDVLEFGSDHVVIATGATWSTDILSAEGRLVNAVQGEAVFTPDQVPRRRRNPRPGAHLRLQPLLHGRLLGRTAAPPRVRGQHRHAGECCFRLDVHEQRGGRHPAAPVGTGRPGGAGEAPCRIRRRHGGVGERLRRRAGRTHRMPVAAHRWRQNAQRSSAQGTRIRPRPAVERRHRIRAQHWRLQGARRHRPRHLFGTRVRPHHRLW